MSVPQAYVHLLCVVCDLNVCECVCVLHSISPRGPAGEGRFKWGRRKALGTKLESFPGLADHIPLLGLLLYVLRSSLPFPSNRATSLSTKAAARYPAQSSKVRPAVIHYLACCLLQFVSLNCRLISE